MNHDAPADFLSNEEKNRMIEHMNEDHFDAVMNFLKVYAGVHNADAVLLSDLDRFGITLVYEQDGSRRQCTVPFEKSLNDKSEIRQTLVNMAQRARGRLDASS
jgi:putative heme iron utilization protein